MTREVMGSHISIPMLTLRGIDLKDLYMHQQISMLDPHTEIIRLLCRSRAHRVFTHFSENIN